MVRGGKGRGGHRGGEGYEGQGIRGSNDDRWESINPSNDLYPDAFDNSADLSNPFNEQYDWKDDDDEDDELR
jgi:hypothetical protein